MNAAARNAHPPGRAAGVRLRAADLRGRGLPASPRRSPCSRSPSPPTGPQLEVPYAEPEIPEELVEQELEELRASVAELAPVEGRPARTGDVLVVDALDENGEGQRDLVVELGSGRLVEEIERALTGASAGRDQGSRVRARPTARPRTATVDGQGDQGEGAAAARRRPGARRDRVRHARRAARRHRARLREVLEEEAETAVPRRRGRPARRGLERPGRRAARRGADAGAPERPRALARAPRHQRRRLLPALRPDGRAARRSGWRRRPRCRSRASSCSRRSPTSSASRSPTRRSRS